MAGQELPKEMKACMCFSSSVGLFCEVGFIVLKLTFFAGAGPLPANAAITSEYSIFWSLRTTAR